MFRALQNRALVGAVLMSVSASMVTIGALVFLGHKRLIAVTRLLDIAPRHENLPGDEELARPLRERLFDPVLQKVVSLSSQIAPDRVRKKVELHLERAGGRKSAKAGEFIAVQLTLAAAGTAGGIGFSRGLSLGPARSLLIGITFGILGAYIPWFRVSRAASDRARQIRRSLPDIIDFMVVCLEAGLTFDMALLKVTQRFRGCAAEEFERAFREIQLGKMRKDALTDMADRVGLEEFSFLVNAIIQAEQLGVGISNVLKLQSDLLREKRQHAVEEQAMKAPVKMLFPLIVFIFPSVFVVILGPAILNLMKALSGK